jgi:hypothetical protein
MSPIVQVIFCHLNTLLTNRMSIHIRGPPCSLLTLLREPINECVHWPGWRHHRKSFGEEHVQCSEHHQAHNVAAPQNQVTGAQASTSKWTEKQINK